MHRIYFPSSMGQRKLGVDTTSKYLFQLFGDNGTLVKTKNSDKFRDVELCDKLRDQLRTKLLSDNLRNLFTANMKTKNPIINIGGDHSMAIATISASLEKHGSALKVIWFDAHGDINTRKTSPSGNYHGMPLAFLTGLDSDYELFPFLFWVPDLKFENILYLGIRDLDDGEKAFIKEKKIKFIRCKEINENPKETYAKIKEFVGKDPLHFSFDVDGLDPEEMSSTGTTAPNGVKTKVMKPIVDKIMKNLNVVGMDITEFNLELGEREKSMKNFTKLFKKYLE
jgi:arginase